MKNIIRLILGLLFCSSVLGQSNEMSKTIRGKVVSVQGGNLFTVQDSKTKYLVKIAGIDVPNFSFRKESTESLSKIAKNKDVILKVLSAEKIENKEFLIAKVNILDKDVALEQISLGMAWIGNDLTKEQKDIFQNTQKAAKENKLGVWGEKFTPCRTKQPTTKYPEQELKNQPIPDTHGIAGATDIEITISEQGNVISAKPLCGHPMLQTISAEAALKSKFEPTIISGVPVRVNGIITYIFTPE